MEYFAGLDVSMAETHVCVMNRDSLVHLHRGVERHGWLVGEQQTSVMRMGRGMP